MRRVAKQTTAISTAVRNLSIVGPNKAVFVRLTPDPRVSNPLRGGDTEDAAKLRDTPGNTGGKTRLKREP